MSIYSTTHRASSKNEPPSPRRANPFVGPVPFKKEDADYFFGREFEARELTALVGSERVVLLYAPSGAGKTSLIEARLIRALERQRFEVLPIVRVGRMMEPGAPTDGPNPYVESALRCLGWSGPTGGPTPELHAHLQTRPPANGAKGQVLIIDQMEEVFTLDPADLPAKREFFRQLGQVLAVGCVAEEPEHDGEEASEPPARRPPYWALLVVREEYLGSLDPYQAFLPNRLTTFRINLLDEKKAMAAVQGPAKVSGVTVSDEVARGIFLSLCRRQVLRPGQQQPETIESPFIEPLHLQIACKQIWNELPSGIRELTGANLISTSGTPGVDRIDAALIKCYRDAVVTAAAQSRTSEREIRLWIDQYLITRYGLRGQFTPDPQNVGLPAEATEALRAAGVLREEERNGRHWLELSHDRLVRPVKADNDAWYEKNLKPHQIAAIAWDKAGRLPTLLLRGAALTAAVAWAARSPGEPSALDRVFLDKSVAQRWTERLSLALWVALVIMLIGIAGLIASWVVEVEKGKQLAEKNNELIARNAASQTAYFAAQFATRAQDARDKDLELALLHATAAMWYDADARQRHDELGLRYTSAIPALTRQILTQAGGRSLIGHTGPITTIQVTDRWVATASQDGTVQLWGLKNVASRGPLDPPVVLRKHTRPITWMAVSPDKTRLATVGFDGTLCVWRLDRAVVGQDPPPEWFSQLEGVSLIRTTFFTSIDDAAAASTWVCAAGRRGSIYFWRLPEGDVAAGSQRPADVVAIEAHPTDSRVSAITFSHRARPPAREEPLLATASDVGDVRFWKVHELVKRFDATGPVHVPADEISHLARDAHSAGTTDLSFFRLALEGQAEELWLASSGNDRAIRLWRLADVLAHKQTTPIAPNSVSLKLTGFARYVVDIDVFPRRPRSPQPKVTLLMSGDDGGEVYAWDLQKLMTSFTTNKARTMKLDDSGPVLRTDPHRSSVTDINTTEDGTWIASASSDGTVKIRMISGTNRPHTIHLANSARAVCFGQAVGQDDRPLLVTGGNGEVARVWDLQEIEWEVKELNVDKNPRERADFFNKLSDEELQKLCRDVIDRRMGVDGVAAHLQRLRETGAEEAADLLRDLLKPPL